MQSTSFPVKAGAIGTSNFSSTYSDSDHVGANPLKRKRTDFNQEEGEIAYLRTRISTLEKDLCKSEQQLRHSQQMCQRLIMELQQVKEQARQKLQKELQQVKEQERQKLQRELQQVKEQERQKVGKKTKVLKDLLISVAKEERKNARKKVHQDSVELGNFVWVRDGTVLSEIWKDGQALEDIEVHLRSLLVQKEDIQKHVKSMKKRQSAKRKGSDSEPGFPEEEFLIQNEICKSRLQCIKRENDAAVRTRLHYDLQKKRHMHEIKRIRYEDGSKFNHFPTLNDRYALLNLLGKGGFGEVYKAFDLVEYRYVACKLQKSNPQCSETKKGDICHATQEYKIHKTLLHPHIVRVWDSFAIDRSTLCTVLEYCGGKDLDAVLQVTPCLSEQEARTIIIQVISALVYLNKRRHSVIHYDLKPGNILFDEVGVAKVTDFGLSKIVLDDVGSREIELTSQGAGTYWYLPPECFDINKTPIISSKVDVWSVGVIFYQMIFGKLPFGHDQTQESVLREGTIIRAHRVDIPARPKVSDEAKDFIQRCLTYNRAERPDVLTVAQDSYLSLTKRKSQSIS